MAVIDLLRPRLEVCSKVFQGVFGHLFYNSPLFLAPSCCSCLLNVMANLICTFFISRPLVLLSSFPEFHYLFCDQNCVSCCSSETFLLDRCHSFFIPLSDGPNFASMWKNVKHQGIIPLYSWRFLVQSWLKSAVWNSQYFLITVNINITNLK
jgi:hypothetical protein